MKRILTTAATLTFLTAGLVAAGPAPVHASDVTVVDPAGGDEMYTDLQRVTVRNNAAGVTVRVRTANPAELFYVPRGELQVRIDVGGSSGPEFLYRYDGKHRLQALKGTAAWKRKWRTTNRAATACWRTVRSLSRWNGQMGVRIEPRRGCLNRPARARVSVKMVERGFYDTEVGYGLTYPTTLVDHLPASGAWTPWAAYSRS